MTSHQDDILYRSNRGPQMPNVDVLRLFPERLHRYQTVKLTRWNEVVQTETIHYRRAI